MSQFYPFPISVHDVYSLILQDLRASGRGARRRGATWRGARHRAGEGAAVVGGAEDGRGGRLRGSRHGGCYGQGEQQEEEEEEVVGVLRLLIRKLPTFKRFTAVIVTANSRSMSHYIDHLISCICRFGILEIQNW